MSYHVGVADDLEVGGRIVVLGGLMELDTKYRFFRSGDDKLHMAVQPAVGYRSLGLIEGFSASLPLMTTYDINDILSINVAPYISYTDFSTTDDDSSAFAGSMLSVGGTIGFQFNALTMHFMPTIEISKVIQNMESGGSSTESSDLVMMFGFVVGFNQGREMAKLNKMDEKLDNMDEKLDKIGDQ
jgi:hypothetical protein